MKSISVLLLSLGLGLVIFGATQQTAQGQTLMGIGGLLLLLGFFGGIIYLCSTLERAMESAIKSAEELSQIKAKMSAIEAKMPRSNPRPTPTSATSAKLPTKISGSRQTSP